MAAYLSTELGGSANQTAAPVGYKPTATTVHARVRSIRATFTLNSQTTSDTLVIGKLPAGAAFMCGYMNSSVSLGSSTLAIGITGTTGKYRTAATFTSTDTPTLFGNVAATTADPLSADETVFATIATATLPSSGTLCIRLLYSQP